MNCAKLKRLKLLAASVVSATALVGCFSDDGSDGTPFSANGGAAKGALVGASCTAIDARGFPVGPVVTGADGSFTLDGSISTGGYPVSFTCSGGSFFNEATGQSVPSTTAFKVVIPSEATKPAKVAVTPLTTLAAELYAKSAVKNAASATAALNQILAALAPSLGGSGLDLLSAPTPVTNGTPNLGSTFADKYAAYMASFSFMAGSNGFTDTNSVLQSLINTIVNGVAGSTVAFDANIVANVVANASSYANTAGVGNAALQSDIADDNTGSGSADIPGEEDPVVDPTGTTGTGTGSGGAGTGGSGSI